MTNNAITLCALQDTIFEWDDPNVEKELIDSFSDAIHNTETVGYGYYFNVTKRSTSLTDLVRVFTGVHAILEGSWTISAKVIGIILLVTVGFDIKLLSNPEGDLLEFIDDRNGSPEINTQIIKQLARENPEIDRALAKLAQRSLVYENKEGRMFVSESSLIRVKLF